MPADCRHTNQWMALLWTGFEVPWGSVCRRNSCPRPRLIGVWLDCSCVVEEPFVHMQGCLALTSSWSGPDDDDPPRHAGYGRGSTTEFVNQLCQHGQLSEAVEGLGVLVQTGCGVSQFLFYAVLKRCGVERDLELGRRVHALALKDGYGSDTFLCNHIMRMYASRGLLQDAMDVFGLVSRPDAFTWSAIISAHVKHGKDEEAIQLYQRMRRSSVKPDGHVFVAALQACGRGGDLKSGQQVHADLMASGVQPDVFVCSGLVDMYAKCGSLEEAQRVFDGLTQKNVVTWNAMIAGYSQQGMGQEALCLFSAMEEEGMARPDSVTFVCALQACASVGIPALEKGKQLHAQIREQGLQGDVLVGGSLVNMFAKCGSLEDARGLFDILSQKNVVTWTAMIAGYSQQGMGEEALRLYRDMGEEGVAALDYVTFVCLLRACASMGSAALEKGMELHAQIREQGLQADAFVASSLVSMYTKCGSPENARAVFDGLDEKNVVMWNALIAGYAQQGMGEEALSLYRAMEEEGTAVPDSVTFICLLQACASLGTSALEKGKQLHVQIRERGLQADAVVGGSLVNMYAKCGSLEDARTVFDRMGHKTLVTWTALIAGYAQQGMGLEALHLYSAMGEEGASPPDAVTFMCLLQACASVAALDVGRQLHAQIEDQGFHADANVGNSLINMYAKSGSMVDAQQVFDALPHRDVVSWSALIAGYTRLGDSEEVFNLVCRMRQDGIQPDTLTFLSVLTVCSHTGLVKKGQEYFEAMSKNYGVPPAVEHYTCMVDLLGRSGHLDEALALVRAMPVLPTAAVWHTLLGACRKWSKVEEGRQAFDEAVKLDKKDASAYVLMSKIYSDAQMWEQAEEMQARRIEIGAWKEPGQSCWTDLDGLVHSFSVGDKKHPEIEDIYSRLKQLFSNMRKLGYKNNTHLDHAPTCTSTASGWTNALDFDQLGCSDNGVALLIGDLAASKNGF